LLKRQKFVPLGSLAASNPRAEFALGSPPNSIRTYPDNFWRKDRQELNPPAGAHRVARRRPGLNYTATGGFSRCQVVPLDLTAVGNTREEMSLALGVSRRKGVSFDRALRALRS
jgi:hypothetical protein